MNGWNIKRDFGNVDILEIQDKAGNFIIVEEGVFIIKLFAFQADAGVFIQIVVGAQIALAQNFIHRFTSVTTEVFVIKYYMFTIAIITTVVTAFGL